MSLKVLSQFFSELKTNSIANKNSFKFPVSFFILEILVILYKEGYILKFYTENDRFVRVYLKYINGKHIITNYSLVSKSSRRVFMKNYEIFHNFSFLDTVIISTPGGLKTNKDLEFLPLFEQNKGNKGLSIFIFNKYLNEFPFKIRKIKLNYSLINIFQNRFSFFIFLDSNFSILYYHNFFQYLNFNFFDKKDLLYFSSLFNTNKVLTMNQPLNLILSLFNNYLLFNEFSLLYSFDFFKLKQFLNLIRINVYTKLKNSFDLEKKKKVFFFFNKLKGISFKFKYLQNYNYYLVYLSINFFMERLNSNFLKENYGLSNYIFFKNLNWRELFRSFILMKDSSTFLYKGLLKLDTPLFLCLLNRRLNKFKKKNPLVRFKKNNLYNFKFLPFFKIQNQIIFFELFTPLYFYKAMKRFRFFIRVIFFLIQLDNSKNFVFDKIMQKGLKKSHGGEVLAVLSVT